MVPARPRLLWRSLGWAAAALSLWVLDVAVWRFIRTRRAGLSGDEPHYLVLARMLAHGSLHPSRFYQADAATHALYAWPPDVLSGTASLHAYRGPHGVVTIHGLGLPALLAPFVAVAGRAGAIAGLMALEALCWVYLFVRVCALAGLRRSARVVTAIAMAGPAVWIASSQLYPDFVAGLFIAVAVLEVAAFEVRGRLGWAGAVALGVSLGLLPWLHIKNLAPAAIVAVCLLAVAWRSRAWLEAGVGAGMAAISWLILLAYDLWAFGRPLGIPQPSPLPSWAALTHGLGLVLDRHQGLAVQVPTIVLAVAGMCLARRVAPAAVVATGASVCVLLYLNATYVGIPYGGTAVAGRFSWSYMAPLLLWLPFAVARFQPVTRLWAIGGGIAVLWLVEAVPILTDRHLYYDAQIGGAPWDPSTYPGWWGPVDRVLPELVPHGPLWGVPGYAVVAAAVIVGAIGALSFAAVRTPPVSAPLITGALAVCAVAVALGASLARLPLPATTVVLAGHDVGSPLITGTTPAAGATVPLRAVGSGTFSLKVVYRLAGEATASAYCTKGTPAHPTSPASPTSTNLATSGGTATLTLRCPAGIIWFQSAAQADSRLDIATVTMRKTRS